MFNKISFSNRLLAGLITKTAFNTLAKGLTAGAGVMLAGKGIKKTKEHLQGFNPMLHNYSLDME